jgi:Amt family ammonium transporter
MGVDTGDNSYVIISSALTMIMTPGLGFFYGGMVNKKNMLTTIAYCFIVFSIVSVVWALIGFSLVFGDTTNSGFIGDCSHCGLLNINEIPDPNYGPTVPVASVFFF